MHLDAEKTAEIIAKFRTHESDTGSPEVQVALLTHRINNLTEHIRSNQKDFSSKRGLFKLVNSRRALLNYVKRQKEERYLKLIEALELRK